MPLISIHLTSRKTRHFKCSVTSLQLHCIVVNIFTFILWSNNCPKLIGCKSNLSIPQLLSTWWPLRSRYRVALAAYVSSLLHKPTRSKSLLKLWVTTFLPDWQPPLIFVQFISNFLCMCNNSMASAHVNQTNIKGGCQSGRKVIPYDSKKRFASSTL